MLDGQLGRVLRELVRLEGVLRAIVRENDPKLAARNARLGDLVLDALDMLHRVPRGTPGVPSAQNLWLAIERCRVYLLTHDPTGQTDLQELSDASEDVRVLSEVVRATLADEASSSS